MIPKRLIWIGAAALMAFTASTPGLAAPRRSVAVAPDWLERPSGDDVAKLYPPIAVQFGISGRVVIACAVDSYGALEDCGVNSEGPSGFEFGEAALALVPNDSEDY